VRRNHPSIVNRIVWARRQRFVRDKLNPGTAGCSGTAGQLMPSSVCGYGLAPGEYWKLTNAGHGPPASRAQLGADLWATQRNRAFTHRIVNNSREES
jgi:hypothetical protein